MHCCGVEGALFTHVGHPVDEITTIGDVGCGGRVGLGRDVVDLTFEHVVKEIRCFYAEYFVDIFLWQCDGVMLISREKNGYCHHFVGGLLPSIQREATGTIHLALSPQLNAPMTVDRNKEV